MQLRFDHLSKYYGDRRAFDIPSLVIESGEFFTFAGPPGSGKSTLVRVISGLESPSTGTLTAGKRVLTDLEAAERDVVITRLSGLGDAGKTHTFTLFDEPLADVAKAERGAMLEALERAHTQAGTTFICATASQEEALRLSDRIAVLREGQVQQVGTPTALFDRPHNTFVASFFGDPPMNVVPGILEKDGVAVEIGPRAIQLDGVIAETYARDVFLGVRPEHIRLATPDTGWRGTVERVDIHSAHLVVEVGVDGGRFMVRADGASDLRAGDRVGVSLAAKHLHVFDERGGRLDVV